jgi:Arc/MetJ-type ribon-helix-helix transcriptional regulator
VKQYGRRPRSIRSLFAEAGPDGRALPAAQIVAAAPGVIEQICRHGLPGKENIRQFTNSRRIAIAISTPFIPGITIRSRGMPSGTAARAGETVRNASSSIWAQLLLSAALGLTAGSRPPRLGAMKTGDDNQSVKMPSSLLAEIQAAADEEHRTSDELVREAVERYLEDRRWQRLLAYGEQQARSLGLTDADVPRLIEEYRQEQRQSR